MKSKKEIEPQLDLDLKEPFTNKISAVKGKVVKSLLYLDTKKYFRDPIIRLFIIGTLTAIFLQCYYIYVYFDSLPNTVPLLTMYLNLEHRLVNKYWLLAIPTISFSMLIGSIILSVKSFNVARIITFITMFVCLLSSASLFYTIAKLISNYNV